MRKWLFAGMVAAVFGIRTPAVAQPAVCGKWETWGCGGAGHKVLLQVPATIRGAHNDCYTCGGSGEEGECHTNCQDTFALSPMAQAAYESVLEAANSGNLSAVIALSNSARGAVVYNAQRGSVQILDCQRATIVANLRIKDPTLQQLAARTLPSSSTLLASTGPTVITAHHSSHR